MNAPVAGFAPVQRRALTDRQLAILNFIGDHIRDRGFPPTLREIGGAFHIRSTNGVNDHLRALERKGYIQRDDLASRGIRVVGNPVAGPVKMLALAIVVDRAALANAISTLESLGEWMPRPMSERYEAAVDDLRTQLLRATPAPQSSTVAA